MTARDSTAAAEREILYREDLARRVLTTHGYWRPDIIRLGPAPGEPRTVEVLFTIEHVSGRRVARTGWINGSSLRVVEGWPA